MILKPAHTAGPTSRSALARPRRSRPKADVLECWPADYREVNRAAYDALADEYEARREADREKDLRLIAPFLRLLRAQFHGQILRVLDLGCGNGLNVAMFAAEGLDVTGIDISSRMLRVARASSPSAHFVHGDFLRCNFAPSSFHGVFAKAIIHLFPKPHALQVLTKVRRILKRHGVFYVTTTIEADTVNGLCEKKDYQHRVYRYRRNWTEGELVDTLLNVGFEVTETSYNREPHRGKTWFNVWATK